MIYATERIFIDGSGGYRTKTGPKKYDPDPELAETYKTLKAATRAATSGEHVVGFIKGFDGYLTQPRRIAGTRVPVL